MTKPSSKRHEAQQFELPIRLGVTFVLDGPDARLWNAWMQENARWEPSASQAVKGMMLAGLHDWAKEKNLL